MSKVIKVENLGKKYIIGHQATERYSTLRDSITKRIKSFLPSSGYKRSEKSTKEEFWALKDINLEVHQGDRVGIIGRNGAGKSTLLKILSRITEPTEGTVKIKGRVASLLEVGTGFHPELTGRENIFLNGGILGMSRTEIKKKFDEIVDFAEVEKFLDTPVKRYSSGMGVRLAFAVAAHLDPELLLVDEVLSVGDLAFRKKCLGKMKDVGKEGRTILFVSHEMNSIRKLCNQGVLLDLGHIIINSNIEETVKKYESFVIKSSNSKSNPVVRIDSPRSQKYFAQVSLLNSKGRLENVFNSGAKLLLEVEMKGELKFDSHFVEWFLNDIDQGNRVAWGATHALEKGDINKKMMKITFEIGPLLLARGKYSFSLAMGVPGVIGLDFWTDAITFDINDAVIGKNKYEYTTRYAPAIIDYEFY